MPSQSLVIERSGIRPRVLPETLLLGVICFADMIQTMIVVHSKLAVEANPVLAAAFAVGPWMFALVKMLSFILPLSAVELLRPLSPQFIRIALRIGSLGYLGVYILGTLHINHLLPISR
jgi:Domain of unknown function (DUF5658)